MDADGISVRALATSAAQGCSIMAETPPVAARRRIPSPRSAMSAHLGMWPSSSALIPRRGVMKHRTLAFSGARFPICQIIRIGRWFF